MKQPRIVREARKEPAREKALRAEREVTALLSELKREAEAVMAEYRSARKGGANRKIIAAMEKAALTPSPESEKRFWDVVQKSRPVLSRDVWDFQLRAFLARTEEAYARFLSDPSVPNGQSFAVELARASSSLFKLRAAVQELKHARNAKQKQRKTPLREIFEQEYSALKRKQVDPPSTKQVLEAIQKRLQANDPLVTKCIKRVNVKTGQYLTAGGNWIDAKDIVSRIRSEKKNRSR